MGRATVTVGRRRGQRERRRALRRSLAASGVLPTYDLLYGSQCGLLFEEQVRQAGYREMDGAWWPTEERALQSGNAVFREGDHGAIYRLDDGTLVHAHLDRDSISVTVAGPTRAGCAQAVSSFQGLYPASFVNTEGDGRIPVTFWANGPHGPVARLRRIEASAWEPIVSNYAADVRDELARLMAWDEPTGSDGQLILWQGPPGTGKTWALRALASEWSRWAEFHYITDPDSFFVDAPSYMVDVLLADSYSVVDQPTGDVYEEQAEGKWRVLILEDTGELLSANAKEKYGQGLSRLLNVVDGMIGQGLRVLVLVTTNDELGELNPAVRRVGRCASQIVFGPLSDDEARAWTGDPDAVGAPISDLFSRYGKAEPRDPAFSEEPEDARDLMAAADELVPIPGTDQSVRRSDLDRVLGMVRAAKNDDVVAEIRRVAEAHQDEATGYGETAWDADTSTVLYVCGDWTDPDPIAADFLAIDGVDGFVSEAEALPDGWWDAEVVYPDDPPRWVVERQENALADVVALAAASLDLDGDEIVASVRELAPAGSGSSALERALAVVATTHRQTLEGIGAIVASAGASEGTDRGNELALRTLDVLERFATRPADPAPTVTVTVPEREQHVHVSVPEREAPQVTVNLPEQPAAPPAHFEIVLPEAAPAPAPIIHVAAAPAPDVHVHVPRQPAPVVEVVAAAPPAPAREAPSAIVVDFDELGRKVYRTVHDDDQEEA